MAIYAISDLHLSFSSEKPMDVFGDVWKNHVQKIAENWDSTVAESDTVLLAGDHSWAMSYDDARADLEFIAARPGNKILIRGNHDYWWRRESTNRLQKLLPNNMKLLHGRALVVENAGITGTRGWRLEQDGGLDAADTKVMDRELGYLKRGLDEMPTEVARKIVMLHYPPFDDNLEPNAFADILKANAVDILVYGHIHSGSYLEGEVNGIKYMLTSADHLNMRPVRVI